MLVSILFIPLGILYGYFVNKITSNELFVKILIILFWAVILLLVLMTDDSSWEKNLMVLGFSGSFGIHVFQKG